MIETLLIVGYMIIGLIITRVFIYFGNLDLNDPGDICVVLACFLFWWLALMVFLLYTDWRVLKFLLMYDFSKLLK